ncbi:MAG: hypothetical protein IKP00_12010 [Victivallales bacterium]|nr:hypothetical protein [Victivallales bacterium]
MSTISSIEFNLTTLKTYNETAQAFEDTTLTGKLYTVEGVTDATGVTLRRLSMAELVMVVCLARAAEKERAVIDIMSEMENTTSILNSLTDIEKKLLEGTSLDNIMDSYTYQGNDYTAKEFLAIVIGGATPNTGGAQMITLWNQLSNNHIVDVEGTYEYNGYTYTKAYDYLYARGITTLTSLDAYNFRSVCEMADSVPDNHVFTDGERENISLYSGIMLEPNATKADLIQAIDDKYKIDILNFVQTLAWQGTGVTNPDSYLPSDIDQLITDIESKMDSLNSFSQQKMIELQSETNKRDQAYDMITNILKSMNTVQVGNANNI